MYSYVAKLIFDDAVEENNVNVEFEKGSELAYLVSLRFKTLASASTQNDRAHHN